MREGRKEGEREGGREGGREGESEWEVQRAHNERQTRKNMQNSCEAVQMSEGLACPVFGFENIQ